MNPPCHSLVRSIDHLMDLFKSYLPCTLFSNSLWLHRTKCACLIKKVVSPMLQANLNEIDGIPYTLLIDKSNELVPTF